MVENILQEFSALLPDQDRRLHDPLRRRADRMVLSDGMDVAQPDDHNRMFSFYLKV